MDNFTAILLGMVLMVILYLVLSGPRNGPT